MLKELIEILSECEYLKNITSCASSIECNSVALMPMEGKVVKTYTDGKRLRSFNAKLLYKSPYFPSGDKNFTADLFFENVTLWLKDLFKNGNIKKGEYNLISISPLLNYVVENKTATVAIYSLEISVYYLK